MHLSFVKFSCGCVGLIGPQVQVEGEDPMGSRPPYTTGASPIIFTSCDNGHDDEGIALYRRDQSDKTYEPIPADKVVGLLADIRGLVADGYKYREVKRLLS